MAGTKRDEPFGYSRVKVDDKMRARADGAEPKPTTPAVKETKEGIVYDPYDSVMIQRLLEKSPEVRFRHPPNFTDDEDRVIAAGIVARVALYRIAQSIHCSLQCLTKHIKATPGLAVLMIEAQDIEKQEVEEGIDDCIRARVPAVLMWKAERLMPDKYGPDRTGDENEDDTQIIIGEIPEAEVEKAEAEVAATIAAAQAGVGAPVARLGAAAESILANVPGASAGALETPPLSPAEEERRAEEVAGGADVPVAPLDAVPPAPAVSPPKGDANFAPFVPAAQMGRVPSPAPAQPAPPPAPPPRGHGAANPRPPIRPRAPAPYPVGMDDFGGDWI